MSEQDDTATKLASQGGIAFAGSFINKLVRFLSVAVVTSIVSAQAFGAYSLSLSIVILLSKFSNLGLDRATDYFIPQHLSSGAQGKAKFVLAVTTVVGATTSCLIVAVVFLNLNEIVAQTNEPLLAITIPIMIVSIPFIALNKSIYKTFNSVQQTKYRSLAKDFIQPISQTVGSVALILAGYQLVGLAAGYLIAVIFASGYAVYALHNQVGFLSHGIERIPVRDILSYSAPLMFSGAMYGVIGEIDFLVIGYMDSPVKNVGYYRTAFVLGSSLLIFHTAISTIFKPMMAEVIGDSDMLRKRYRLASRWALLFTLPPAITITLAPDVYLGYLFDPEYAIASSSLFFLAAGYTVSVALGPEGKTLEALGYTRLTLLNTAVMLLTNATLDLVLVPQLGIVGAAIGTASAVTLTVVLGLSELYYLERISPLSARHLRLLLAGAMSLVVGYGVVMLLSSRLVTFLTLPVVVTASYVLFAILLNVFTSDDLEVARIVDDKLNVDIISRMVASGIG